MEIKLKLFNQKAVRTVWNADEEEWYFSVVDVCNVLSDSAGKDPGAYWRKLKQRLKAEGSEVVTKCHELKMQAADGKYYKTDALNTKGVLRLPQKPSRSKSGWRKSAANASTKSPIPKRRSSAAQLITAKRVIRTNGSISGFGLSKSGRSSPTNGAPAAWRPISNTLS